MSGTSWFLLDDPADELELDEAELAFVARLQELAQSWAVSRAGSWVGRSEEDSLLVCVTLSDRERRVSLLNIGVHVTAGSMKGDRLHSQLHFLPDEPTDLAVEALGGPNELAAQAASWFEAVLSRPLARCEWAHAGQVYATEWMFWDTGEPLVRGIDRRLAPPPGEATDGGARGFWANLAKPDRVVMVRSADANADNETDQGSPAA
ncbi:hypothetical protein [Actinacidiphila glaucinigra]|uniref:hypothetical protein n=1 Tax=Actinacidiphila glaucinigra TaxID=235986 RepID=UPI00382E140F